MGRLIATGDPVAVRFLNESSIHVRRCAPMTLTWPVQAEQQLLNNVRSHIDTWRERAWQPTEEINFILSTLIQDHTNLLTKKNEQAIESGELLEPTRDTKLILLQGLSFLTIVLSVSQATVA